jgi:hypothetical protein
MGCKNMYDNLNDWIRKQNDPDWVKKFAEEVSEFYLNLAPEIPDFIRLQFTNQFILVYGTSK